MTLDFDNHLAQYADLAVRVGVNLRAGQRLVVLAPIAAAPYARRVAASAYRAGARLVEVFWSDDELTRARFEYAPRDSFAEYPSWRGPALVESAARGDALLQILAEDPDLLSGFDPELVHLADKTAREQLDPFIAYVVRNAINWCVISAPIPAWATRVFPELPAEAQVPALWDAIFDVCRVKQPDPVAAWGVHIQDLKARSETLTRKAYAALHYRGPGTDLTIGLPEGHLWTSGRSLASNGIEFTSNMPTEEVFTLPHKGRVDGQVRASKPLSHANTLIEDFTLTFAGGRVVGLSAAKGEEILRKLVGTDEGAGRLGEVSLLPHSSPIAQSGLMFYNTLFDENAASHLALGKAYPFTLQGGTQLSEEEFAAAGGNHSLIHVDFMIGSADLDVDGVTRGGAREAVMRAGEWAFDV